MSQEKRMLMVTRMGHLEIKSNRHVIKIDYLIFLTNEKF